MRTIYLFLLVIFLSFAFAPIPFERDEKPMPKGNWSSIIPTEVAGYKQIAFQEPTKDDDGAAYYRNGKKIIYISFNHFKDANQLQEWMDVAEGDTMKMGSEVNKSNLEGEKKYVLYGKNNKFFFAWNRGMYYFDVLCEHGKDEMDNFMKAFPY